MLIGDKVCLGPVLQGDAPQLFNWCNRLDLARMNGPYRPMDQAQFNAWLKAFSDDPARVIFALRRQGDLRLMGYVQLTNINPVARSAELGILIGEISDQGQGYGQQAVGLLIDFAWRDLNLQRLVLYVLGDNPRAVQVYLKCGFIPEGVMRRAAYVDGGFRDITVMGLLRDPA